jgi:two-component system, sensor histidine kinase YesM
METKTEVRNYPIKHYVRMLLLISFATLMLDMIISGVSVALVQRQSAQYLRNTADLYIDRINNNFAYLNHFMGWTLANDEDLKIMNKYEARDAAFIKSHRNLYKRYAELQKSLGAEYNFFIYLPKNGFFANSAPMNLSYPEFKTLEKQVIESVEDKVVYEQYYSRWTTIELNGSYSIINIVPYYDSYMISLISADKLIRPLRDIDLGGEGYITLMNRDGESITGPLPDGSKLLKVFQFGTTVNREFSNATFYVKLVIQFGAFEKIMIAQLLVVLLGVIIACYLSFIMLYFQKKVLTPIKNFSKNLTVLTSDGEPVDFENSKIIELERANKQYIDLVKQLKDIKIEMYERELEKQRIQLQYMKLQIKPHFFLNGLTTIYSMSQMHMYEEIQKMTMSISNYFRYIFQHDQDFVRLADELEHIRVYLEIQRQRYRNAFHYRIVAAESAADVDIPPLIL